ncbi:hypothetical protein LCGC14_2245420 [marine sediment metagenome]|uniref:Uncharacterized protein n=1 Tax=marine sediment metagenome TaxID=412755 RepID=A0A0F9FZ87_9ZZZZ
MTRWERFYRALGGTGTEVPPFTSTRLRWWHVSSHLAWFLLRTGFLSRDPDLPLPKAGYFVNYRWQWRFWRGPYRDCLERDGRLR